MTGKQSVQDNPDLELQDRIRLHRLLLKISLFRLFFLTVLFLPLGLIWWDHFTPEQYLHFFLEPAYQVFLVSGLSLTLFFILSRPYFKNALLLFRLQLLGDFFLACFLVLLTGGLQSHFSFLFLTLIFLYGRILGTGTAKWIALGCSLFFTAVFFLDATNWALTALLQDVQPGRQPYYLTLQLLALALVLTLLHTGNSREDHLLFRLAAQERLLRRSEVIKSKVLDWMPSGVLLLDRQGKISSINYRAWQWSRLDNIRACIGKPLAEIFPDLYSSWIKWDQKDSFRTEIFLQNRQKIFGATFTPIAQEQASLILFADITRIKELEKKVQQMEKLASIGELAAGLAHEIKNPLAGVKGSLQLIGQDRLKAEQKKRLQQIVHSDIQRLDNLLTDFLSFARPSQACPSRLNLAENIAFCMNNIQCNYPELEARIQPDLENTYWDWDRDQLQQVLFNLILNGVQAGLESGGGPVLNFQLDQDYKGCYLSIMDNGPGLPAENQEKLFDPFVTNKEKGSGLGLAIAQRLADQNKSWIELRNHSSLGAEARIYYTRYAAGTENLHTG